jgi:hypothetical protein
MTSLILAGLPHPTLQRNSNVMNVKTVQGFKRQILANLASVPSTNGGGQYGYTGCFLPAVEYNALPNAAPWIPVPFPGLTAAIPNGAPAAAIAQLTNAHKVQLDAYNTEQELLRHTKQALLAAIEPKYISRLSVGDFGFATCTPVEIMDFITVNSGRYYIAAHCIYTDKMAGD